MHLRLHTRFQNSAGERVRIVLNLKGIAYEYVPIASLSAPEYRRINPHGLMPALEIDGRFVAQSMAIIELLEELFPEPSVYPADQLARAEARAFALDIAADLHPINNQRVRRYLATELGIPDAGQMQWYRHWIKVTLDSLETKLARRQGPFPYCFSETPGVAEACLVPQLANARRFDCDLSAYPLLNGIDERCRALPAFVAARPDQQPDYRPA